MKTILLKSIISLISLIAGISTVYAYDFQVRGLCYDKIDNGKNVSLVLCNPQITSVVIPDSVTYKGISYKVTSIGDSAFTRCNNLTSVTIPSSVTSIGNAAFFGCSSLTQIDYNAKNCSDFSSSHTPFNDCGKLSTIKIGEGVERIPANFAYRLLNLTSVEISNSVTSIGETAFFQCSRLASVTIPSSVTYIGDNAFMYCSSLTQIDFNAKNCSNFYYSNHPFRYCEKLSTIKIGEGVERIPAWFAYDLNLPSVELPNSVTSIGKYAFKGCSGYTSVTIPSSVTYIGESAFSCTEIDFNAKNCKDFNPSSHPFSCLKIKIGEGVERIPAYFAYGLSLTSVEIPNSVTSIGNSAFYGCRNLVSVEIPNSVTSIGNSAFYDCSNLVSVEIPNSLTFIGNLTFSGCSNLVSVEIPNSVTSIGNSAFSDCSNLVSVEIPNSVTSIGNSAFSDCSNLVSVEIPNSVTSIGNSAFYNCSNLVSVEIPNSLTLIGTDVFSCCYSLASVIIPNSVIEIGKNAFSHCDRITSLTIPNSVTSIGSSAFYNCTKLKSITFGSGLRTIGESAFGNTSIKKAFWLCNTQPTGAGNVGASINCVANNNFTLPNTIVYPFLSSKFEVDGTIYVPVSPSERTCDVIDCNYEVVKTNIVVSDKVTNKGIQLKVLNINDYAFYDRKDIRSLKLSNKGTIGSNAFSGCYSLYNVSIDDGVTNLGDNVFYGCSAIKELEVPKSVTSIGKSAFSFCRSITKVRFEKGNSKLTLGSNGSSPLFADCPLEEVYIGRDLSYQATQNTGYSPFYRNTTLTSVEITDAEDEIYDYEFYGCSNLKSLRIGNGVISIGQYAFSGCSSLDFFSIGSNVKTIGDEAFSDCTSLTKFHTKAIVPPICGTQALDDINKWECKLYVPDGSINQYQQADQWKDFFFVETGLSGVNADTINLPIIYYNLNGMKVDGNLTPGIYIRRQGSKTDKIVVK